MKSIRRMSVVLVIVAGMVLSMGSSSCEVTAAPPSTAKTEMRQNESNQKRMQEAVPAPRLQTSLERKNISRRLEKINQEEMVSYIYLVSYGKVMAYYAVRGKVSSLNSYLTAMERVEKVHGGGMEYPPTFVTLEAPDLDGTYGSNPNGIFFFTTEGVYVEWNGEYIWSDQPLSIAQPPELIQNITSK